MIIIFVFPSLPAPPPPQWTPDSLPNPAFLICLSRLTHSCAFVWVWPGIFPWLSAPHPTFLFPFSLFRKPFSECLAPPLNNSKPLFGCWVISHRAGYGNFLGSCKLTCCFKTAVVFRSRSLDLGERFGSGFRVAWAWQEGTAEMMLSPLIVVQAQGCQQKAKFRATW